MGEYQEPSSLEEQESHHPPIYVHALRQLRESASSLAMSICRAWHGDHFAWPGYGGVEWVADQLEQAKTAIRVIAESTQ